MSNSIDGNRSSSSAATSFTQSDQTAQADQATATPQSGDAPADGAGADCGTGVMNFFDDSWESDCSEGENFMSQASRDSPTDASHSPGAPGGESISVLDLQAQASASAAPGHDALAQNPAADALAELISGSDIDFEDIAYCTDNARAFGPINQALSKLSATDRRSLAALVADPGQARAFFREALQGREDIPDGLITDRSEHLDAAADALIEEIQTHIVADVEAQVASRVQGIVRKASEPYQAINASGESRRAFLGQLAQLEGDAGKLEQRLSAFGLDQEAAGDIAEVLSEAHGDPEAIASLVAGEEGPDRAGIHLLEEGNAYAFAEAVLEEELEGKLDLLKQFSRQAGNGQITDSILTNDNFKTLRKQVISEMSGGKNGPIEKVVADYTANVESEQQDTEWLKIGIQIITAVGVTVATAGLGGAAALGATVATTGVESAPDLMVAWEDVDLAELAAKEELVMPDGTRVAVAMTDEDTVDTARHNRNVTTAFAVAGLVLGAAPALKEMKHGAAYADDAVDVGELTADMLKDGETAFGMGAASKGAEK